MKYSSPFTTDTMVAISEIPQQSIFHDVFVVVTEEEYGGANNGDVKVFYLQRVAEDYIERDNVRVDEMIIRQTIRSPWGSVYVVVFEMFYGGEDNVRCFSSRVDAEQYLEEKGRELNLDGFITETDVLVS